MSASTTLLDVLVVVAHPDDESFGCGSTIAHVTAAGGTVAVCCAGLGEAGEVAPGFDPGGRELAEIRYDELARATRALGAELVEPLGLRDSGWDSDPPPDSICGVPEEELIGRVESLLRRHPAHLVLTLAGDDGHRDHRRLGGAVNAAFQRLEPPGAALYRWCLAGDLMRRWAEEMVRLRPETAHLAVDISALGTPREHATVVLDTSAQLERRRRAIACHASQVSPYDGLSPALAEAFLTTDYLIRVAPADPTETGARLLGDRDAASEEVAVS